MNVNFMSLQKMFYLEIRKELNKSFSYVPGKLTEKEIIALPDPVQRFFRHCGYLGKEKIHNARIEWKDTFLKMSLEKGWSKINCYQFNFVPEPARIVYMKSKMAGVFPFEARDKYQNGEGNMRIKLLKIFTIDDVRGKEMNESALVTVLSETFLIPNYAMQNYISWRSIDSTSAEATSSYNGTKVRGIFYFNEQGEFIRFETNDRYHREKDGTFKKIKWSVEANSYTEKKEIKFPTLLKAFWHTENVNYEYFKGIIVNIDFNVR